MLVNFSLEISIFPLLKSFKWKTPPSSRVATPNEHKSTSAWIICVSRKNRFYYVSEIAFELSTSTWPLPHHVRSTNCLESAWKCQSAWVSFQPHSARCDRHPPPDLHREWRTRKLLIIKYDGEFLLLHFFGICQKRSNERGKKGKRQEFLFKAPFRLHSNNKSQVAVITLHKAKSRKMLLNFFYDFDEAIFCCALHVISIVLGEKCKRRRELPAALFSASLQLRWRWKNCCCTIWL